MGLSPDQKRSPRIQTRSRYLGTRSSSANSKTNNSSNRDCKARSSSCNSHSKPRNKHFGKASSQGFRQQGTSSQVFRLAEVSIPPVRLSAASNSRALGSRNRDSVANSPQARRVRRSLLAASLESRPIAVKSR